MYLQRLILSRNRNNFWQKLNKSRFNGQKINLRGVRFVYRAQEKSNIAIKNGRIASDKQHWHPILPKEDAKLSDGGLSFEQRESVWNQLHSHLFSYQSAFLGFQINQSFNSEKTKLFMDMAINNDGDPFSASSLDAMNTKVMECAVLDYFAKLWGIQQSNISDEKERAYWGYITSMGSSEGSLLALLNARDYLAGMPLNSPTHNFECPHADNKDESESHKVFNEHHGTVNQSQEFTKNGYVSAKNYGFASSEGNPNNFTPVVFFAQDCHHGFEKALRVLQMKSFGDIGSGKFPCPLKYPNDYPSSFSDEFIDQNGWPRAVPVEEDGSISIPCLVKLVTSFVLRGYPPLVIFTCGTTFKGANDNAQAAINELVPILKQHDMYERRVYSSEHPIKSDVRNGFWFHIDGALGGAQLRFLEMAINQGLVRNMFPDGFPVFDFRIPEVKSLVMSLHKWFGCPVPSSVFVMRKMDQVKPLKNPLCIGGLDSTLSGSRGGHSVLFMWDLLSKMSYDDFRDMAVRGVEMVAFSMMKLQELQKELPFDLWLSHTPGSLFVYFRQPNQDIVRRYCLGSKLLKVKTVGGTFEDRIYSQICLMPHVTENLVLHFIEELRAPGAFSVQK